MIDWISNTFDSLQQALYESVVQPIVFGLGFGNLLEDGRCALLFPAYREGRSLQVAGRARIEKYTNGDIDLDTGRGIRVAVEHVIEE